MCEEDRRLAGSGAVHPWAHPDQCRTPEDIVFTEIVGHSPAGFEYTPVLVEGDASFIMQEVLFAEDPTFLDDMEFFPLPHAPDQSKDFALGVIVDIPADADDDPEPVIVMSGAKYTTDGKDATLQFDRVGLVSRPDDNGEWCAKF